MKKFIPPAFVFLWATGFIGARYAMPWSEPFTFLAIRFVVAAILLATYVAATGSLRVERRQAWHSVVAGALMHGGYLGGCFWAIRNGMPAGISALIVGLQPLITAVLAGTFLSERILPRHWLGLAIGLVGVVTVLFPKLGLAVDGISWPTLAAMVFAVLAMATGTIWQKRHVGSANLIAGTFYQYLGGAAPMILGSLLLETRTLVWNAELVFALVWLVLVLSIGAIVLLMIMIRDGEMAKVSSLFYLVPAVTAVIAYALFGEELTWIQVAGMAIATFGVGLATVKRPVAVVEPL